MGKRFKTKIDKPAGPRSLGLGGAKRLEAGEPWLRVWSQELAVPLATIAKKSGIGFDRLLDLEADNDVAASEEFEAIAAALGTDAETIEGFQE